MDAIREDSLRRELEIVEELAGSWELSRVAVCSTDLMAELLLIPDEVDPRLELEEDVDDEDLSTTS